MIQTRPPSTQGSYNEYWPGDPAFVQPPVLPDDANEAAKVEHAKALKAHERKIEIARETGDWTPLRVEGGSAPTLFVMRQVDRNVWRSIYDRMMLPADSKRRIGPAAAPALLFRLALDKIENLGDYEVKRGEDGDWDGWIMARPGVVSYLDMISAGIVTDIGNAVFKRLVAPNPKS